MELDACVVLDVTLCRTVALYADVTFCCAVASHVAVPFCCAVASHVAVMLCSAVVLNAVSLLAIIIPSTLASTVDVTPATPTNSGTAAPRIDVGVTACMASDADVDVGNGVDVDVDVLARRSGNRKRSAADVSEVVLERGRSASVKGENMTTLEHHITSHRIT